jgi:hypothetical protein
MSMNVFFVLLLVAATTANASDYGDHVGQFPREIMAQLAEANAPDASGAIGRNKIGYFHVRFQRGMHHVADYALATKQVDIIDRFLTAVEYSLQRQLPSGDFELVIPDELRDQSKPGIADRASGIAFFASSLGLGLYALETNDWFQTSPDCERPRSRLSTIKPRLRSTLSFLIEHETYLEAADQKAPNRLLFDAIAYITLGRLLNDNAAARIGSTFADRALEQIDPQDGYFVEGSGFDSSYNGVATALALRLLMLEYRSEKLESISSGAVRWQKSRILASGEISTEGNSRVRPGKSGESFLGREKDVDVGHTLEALMLASHRFSSREYSDLASQVVEYYSKRR